MTGSETPDRDEPRDVMTEDGQTRVADLTLTDGYVRLHTDNTNVVCVTFEEAGTCCSACDLATYAHTG